MAYKTIEIDMFAEAVTEILQTYANTTADEMNEIADSVSKEAVNRLKETSPRKSGAYARGWTRKADKSKDVNEYTVYNKDKPQLTHLLEKGHAVKPEPKNPGKKARVAGKEHIAPVEEWASEEMVKRAVNKL